MPETLGGLALFAAVLVPGFVYLERRESRQAGRKYSPLRETGQILFASLGCDVVVVGIFAIVRAFAPSVTPDIGALVRDGSTFGRHHYQELAAWGVAALAAATALASLLAVPPRFFDRLVAMFQTDAQAPVRQALARRRRSTIAGESAWSAAFLLYPDRVPYLGVTLLDGTYLFGRLFSCNPQIEETTDRSLVLAKPIAIRRIGPVEDVHQPLDADTLVLSADQIQFVTVSYLPDVLADPFPVKGGEGRTGEAP